MCVDLHIHSLYSDGTATPAKLIELARVNQLAGFALTDHDTVEGVPEVLRLGEEHGLQVVSGVEINAHHGDLAVHILGYGFDPEHAQLKVWLGKLQQFRNERNLQILDNLAALGIKFQFEELKQFSHCGQTGRPHIARLLVAKGYVKNTTQAFDRYLGREKVAWCSRFTYSAAESIAIIHQAGGVAVLAHPGIIDLTLRKQPQLIRELTERHLDGLEIHYPRHTKKVTQFFSNLAQQYNLLTTGGSDYHGDQRIKGLAGSATGFCPPDSIITQLSERITKR